MTRHRRLDIGGVTIGNDMPLVLIAGPCQLEGLDHALAIAEPLKAACAANGLGFIFKGSFDKANRTAAGTPRGPGMDAGLAVLAGVKARLGVPVLTDIHLPAQAAVVAEVADVLQIPAFLSRQTDLLQAAGRTGRAVNIKKGQFLAPWDMARAAEKVAATGNAAILLTERGTSFGYNTLVADMRALPIMGATGYPVIMDATHAVQMPGGQGEVSGGDRRMAPVLARAAVALGIGGVFIETHPDPDNAPSDGPNMIRLDDMSGLIGDLAAFDRLAKARPMRLD
ncbi:3-deoxy-8-phosphooctulonate synthase [Maritimibacter sp. HL-12]|jgi:2-dehydro-3-deoxyphosphooctonate aldolase (KDO 8-P synthase)|uniref:3-deoxy-8-phosphooctulonate synthase n=1 Tax=Maritimibacter sp. HL-12 TaxID=1162418 RepID=UPI000A0EFFEF|nr:3-deoxy-8-phosphooctulonate synthase [Maritimibacter sp. HL-12]SMH35224.1 2-dehydro-3-deoxyphosphooctonate aldolase (KDO 8-P synthase) [Maritimibacter sp. HL-12]